MSTYRNTITGEIRDLDDALISAWQAAGNPKAGQWEAYTPPPEPPSPPTSDWATFKATALNSSSLNSILSAAYGVVPVAAGALAPALLAAEQGRISDFAASWSAICAAVPVDPQVITGFVGVATDCNLPVDFIAALTPTT